MNYIAFAAALICGAGIAFLNYLISKKSLGGKANTLPIASLLRTVISVVFLVILFLIGQKTTINEIYLLLGGALGLTVPSVFFTMKLLKNTSNRENDNG